MTAHLMPIVERLPTQFTHHLRIDKCTQHYAEDRAYTEVSEVLGAQKGCIRSRGDRRH
jgi:hypothetical protein